jgi:hypothetical protein
MHALRDKDASPCQFLTVDRCELTNHVRGASEVALSGCTPTATTDAGVKVETLYYLDANERRSWH